MKRYHCQRTMKLNNWESVLTMVAEVEEAKVSEAIKLPPCATLGARVVVHDRGRLHVGTSSSFLEPLSRFVSRLSSVFSCTYLDPLTEKMWQDNNNVYGAGTSQSQYYAQPAQPSGVPLQFYAPSPVGSSFYSASRTSLDGNVGAQGTISSQGAPPAYGGNIQAGGWWTAFGTGGLEGEPPLLEGQGYCGG